MNQQQCIGITSKGDRCKRKVTDSSYCYQHTAQQKVDKQLRECVICYENLEIEALKCNHYICEGCLEQLRKPCCPVCRKELEGLPEKLLAKIINAERKDKREREAELPPLDGIIFAIPVGEDISPTTIIAMMYQLILENASSDDE